MNIRKTFAIGIAALAMTVASMASAQSTSGSNSNSQTSSGAAIYNSENIEGSVVGGSLPGGRCTDAYFLGAPGVGGVGISKYRKTCERFGMAESTINQALKLQDAGVYTTNQVAVVAAEQMPIMRSGGKRRAVTPTRRPAPATTPKPVKAGYTLCSYDKPANKITIAYRYGADKPAATEACKATFGF